MAVNGLTPVPLERFGGIDWRDDPDEVKWNAAIDCFNVDLDPRGALRPRSVAAFTFGTPAGAVPYSFLPYLTSTGAQQWIVAYGATRVDAYNATGTILASGVFPSSQFPYGIQPIGDPNGTRVYVGNGTDPIGYWNANSNTWVINSTMATLDGTTGKAMPAGRLLAATPWDNRLAVAGFNYGVATGGPGGIQSSIAHVWFSEPANPTAVAPNVPTNVTDWKSNNYVVLTPGDGEPINAMVVWNNQLFVFKQSKFFVFYGVSSDATGKPIFNYRTVNTGVGVDVRGEAGTSGLATAGPDGVYFAHASGIYHTSGGSPVRISDAIRAAFPGGSDDSLPYYAGSAATAFLPVVRCQDLAWRRDRLYVSFLGYTTNTYGVFVWDRPRDAWMLWDIPARALHSLNDHLYCTKNNATGIYEITSSNAESMTCVYQSAFSQLGQDAREKTIRETQVVGRNLASINLQLGWARDSDDRPSPSVPSMYSLSGQGTAGRFYQRQAEFGEKLSWRLSATGTQNPGNWLVQRVVPMLRESAQGKSR